MAATDLMVWTKLIGFTDHPDLATCEIAPSRQSCLPRRRPRTHRPRSRGYRNARRRRRDRPRPTRSFLSSSCHDYLSALQASTSPQSSTTGADQARSIPSTPQTRVGYSPSRYPSSITQPAGTITTPTIGSVPLPYSTAPPDSGDTPPSSWPTWPETSKRNGIRWHPYPNNHSHSNQFTGSGQNVFRCHDETRSSVRTDLADGRTDAPFPDAGYVADLREPAADDRLTPEPRKTRMY